MDKVSTRDLAFALHPWQEDFKTRSLCFIFVRFFLMGGSAWDSQLLEIRKRSKIILFLTAVCRAESVTFKFPVKKTFADNWIALRLEKCFRQAVLWINKVYDGNDTNKLWVNFSHHFQEVCTAWSPWLSKDISTFASPSKIIGWALKIFVDYIKNIYIVTTDWRSDQKAFL